MLGESMHYNSLLDRQESQENTNETTESVLQNGKERQEKAEWIVNKSVEFFVNNLGKDLTMKLISTYEDFKNEPKFSWLSNSNIWLESLKKVHQENKDKILWDEEMFLNKFIFLLNELAINQVKLDNLTKILEQQIMISESLLKLERDVDSLDKNWQNERFFGWTRVMPS